MREELNLSNFARGELEKDFQRMYREVLSQITGKEKGTITITLSLQRIENTDMMVDTSYTIKKAVPAKAKKAMAMITESGILTEKPKEPVLKVVDMFAKDGEV
jgi:hypothetical protein